MVNSPRVDMNSSNKKNHNRHGATPQQRRGQPQRPQSSNKKTPSQPQLPTPQRHLSYAQMANGGHAKAQLHFQQQQQQRQNGTPQRHRGPTPPHNRGTPSPNTLRAGYAGSKCYEPPTAQSLPKPPPSWGVGVVTTHNANDAQPASPVTHAHSDSKSSPLKSLMSAMQQQAEREGDSRDGSDRISDHLKFLLKVQA